MNEPFAFGVDYYPEQWPEERWAIDARLMKEAGINVVRLAEFAWGKMEPVPGRFVFDWLDRAIRVLAEAGIRVVLGTPTASAPPWLFQRHPDAYRVDENGRRQTYGNRRNYCPNHDAYRQSGLRITSRMAATFANHPNVIGWQIDNEFGDRCYCPLCIARFQDWLRERYGSLDALNARWGTAFWAHEYSEWSQIPAPLKTGGAPNPGLALDYDRFCSDTYCDFQREQVDLLHAACPGHFVTHNLMGFHYSQLNYFDLARDLDFVSWDCYTRHQWNFNTGIDKEFVALSHATMRGLKRRNYWVMEQQSGAGGWELIAHTPRPGQIRLWAYQSIAHGADGVVFFRWRTARFGTEQYWHGILNHAAQVGQRCHEVARMGAELGKIGADIQGATVQAQVAIVQDYDSRFAFQIQPNHPQFSYLNHIQDIYAAFHRRNIAVDVISPQDSLAGYRLVIAPALHVLRDDAAARLREYVRSGGTLLVTPRSGVKNEDNAVVNAPLPGLLADLCGAEVEEYYPLLESEFQPLEVEPGGPGPLTARLWCDVLQPASAQPVARYTRDTFSGRAAITLNAFGDGKTILLGTFGGADLYAGLLDWLCGLAGVEAGLETPEGVEACVRHGQGGRFLFLLNHTGSPQQVKLDRPAVSLFDPDRGAVSVAQLDSYGVEILREENDL